MNLISYSKFFSGERDSLSLFFEYSNKLEMIRIHKVYYVFAEFERLIGSNEVINKLNLHESIIETSVGELLSSIKNLVGKKSSKQKLFSDASDLFEVLNSIIEQQFSDLTIHLEALVAKLNDAFFLYCFSLKKQAFILDDVYRKIEEKIGIFKSYCYDYEKVNETKQDELLLDEIDLYELRVFNVGQANCSALIKYKDKKRSDYNVVIVFDLGYQKKNGKNVALDEMISKIDKTTTIIISHFHQDHINNIVKHCNIDTNRWIFPLCDLSKFKTYKSFQVLLCVVANNTQFKMGSSPLFKIPEYLKIHQHIGIALDSYQSDEVNAQSLVCELNIGEKRVLIPGDALYEEYDTLNLEKPFDFVLVPHHGCKYLNKNNNSNNLKIRKVVDDKTFGIVSCGNNSYGHANSSHLSWYSNYYLFYKTTLYDDRKIIINISKEKKVDYYPIFFKM